MHCIDRKGYLVDIEQMVVNFMHIRKQSFRLVEIHFFLFFPIKDKIQEINSVLGVKVKCVQNKSPTYPAVKSFM